MNLFIKSFQIKAIKINQKLDRFNQETDAIQRHKILVKVKKTLFLF